MTSTASPWGASGATKRLRIAVVTPLFPISTDQTRGLPLYRTVLELGRLADVEVFVPVAVYPKWKWLQPRSYAYSRPDLAFQFNGVPAHYIEYPTIAGITRSLNGFRVMQRLRDPVRAFLPDVILAYWLYPEGYGAYRIARKLQVPFVVGIRGSDVFRLPDALTSRMVGDELAHASGVLAVSGRMRDRAVELGGVSDRVKVVLNGCDRSHFHPRDRAEARRALGVSEQADLVLFVGNLVRVKGADCLVQAAITLSARRPNLEVVIAGKGVEQDALRQTAAAGRLKARFPGSLDPADVAAWMAACDVFCLPSRNEGCPNVVLEALSSGRPVVASDVGAVPNLLREHNGIVVPPRATVQLVAALDEALRRQWDSAAIAATFQRGWDVVARETFDVCQAAYSGHPADCARAASASVTV